MGKSHLIETKCYFAISFILYGIILLISVIWCVLVRSDLSIEAGIYHAMANMTLDTLIPLLIYHAAGQLRLLKDNLTHLNERAEDEVTKEGKATNNEMKTILKDEIIYRKICICIDHYDIIFKYVCDLEELYASIVFFQFLGSIVVICISCFLLTVLPPTSVQFYAVACFMISLLTQLFLFCYAGALLYDESITITDAIYMSEWYTYDAKSKKALIILMERTKRAMKVTAGKVFDLSLDTFTMIIRRSYSLLAVLKNN